MFRVIWLILAFLISAAISYGLTPAIHGYLVDVIFSGSSDITLRNAMPGLSTGLTVFAVLSTLLGPVVLVIIDSRKTKAILERLNEAHPTTGKSLIKACQEEDYFIEAAEDYTASFRSIGLIGVDGEETAKTTHMAERFFPVQKVANTAIFPHLFWTIAIAIIIVGIGLFLKAWLIEAEADPITLKSGIFGIAMCFVGAVGVLGLLELAKNHRVQNTADFTNHLNRKFHVDQTLVFETALANMGQSLRGMEASFKSAQDAQNKELQTLISQALKNFVSELEKTEGSQFASLDKILKEATSNANVLNNAYQDQLKQLSKGINTAFKSIKDNETALIKSYEKSSNALQMTLDKHHKALDKSISQLSDTIKANKQDNETITQAAEDMLAASKASRETVERFITLAERLREAGRGAQNGESQLLANRDTSKRLSAALKDLKRNIDGND